MGKPLIAGFLGYIYLLLAAGTFLGFFMNWNLSTAWTYVGFSLLATSGILVAIFGFVVGFSFVKGAKWGWYLAVVVIGLGVVFAMFGGQWLIAGINCVLVLYLFAARKGFGQSDDFG